MGVLSIYFKSNFLGLLKFLNNINWFIVFFSLINLSVCIYEDQIGKFDWRQSYVGRIKFSQFDTVSTAKKLIVATEENVLAALNLKTGQVVWRHVFETASSGNIQLLHVTDKVVTVTGSNPYLVRGWDSSTGILLWEWSLTLQNNAQADFSEWWIQRDMLVHVLPTFGSHIEVSLYNLMTGQNRGATSKLPASWTNFDCVWSPPYFSCISGPSGSEQLISLDVTSSAIQIITKPLPNFSGSIEDNLQPLDANSILPGFVMDDKKIVLIEDHKFRVLDVEVGDFEASVAIVDGGNGPIVIQVWNDDAQDFILTAHDLTGKQVPEMGAVTKSVSIPSPILSAVTCSKPGACRLLVTGQDHAAHLLQQQGRSLWSREEALANVVVAEFVDLPVSELDAAIESEFDQKEAAKMYSSIWAAFSRRIHTQLQQLQTLIQSVQSREPTEKDDSTALVRDYFNLHKVIVLVTEVGKIFGMDNLSGRLLWQHYEPSLDTEGVVLLTRRSARHPPHEARVTVVGKDEDTGTGLIIDMNPITGVLSAPAWRTDARLMQAAVLHRADAEALHALVLLDEQENVQILPVSASSLVENFYMYVAHRSTALMKGYALKYDGTSVVAQQTWTLNLGGDPGAGHRIVSLVGKSRYERVHSAGRVLGDRSVLYKYSNPNLLLVVTQGPDAIHKDTVVATLVDGASGGVVAAQAARRARALSPAVHKDNFVAYCYYNDKQRRVEIATMELYEGAERWLPAGTEFSSLASERAPSVERQTYILPATPTAAQATHTERGIADSHVLMALSTGAILELPWAYLEPRRPVTPSAEQREEGLIPYAPELPLPSEAVINYNRTLHRVNAIYTAPSGLESTSLVLATGLDIFYTRVAPSKTFDLLKDDFDYYLITIVLAALIVATYSTKYFATRKMIKQAWK